MPEGPEVRLDAEFLDFALSNRYLNDIAYNTDLFCNKCKGIEELKQHLPLKFVWVRSREKKLFFCLTNTKDEYWYLFITYGMTGGISQEEQEHSHIKFEISSCWIGFNTIYYHDPRRLGSFEASNDPKIYQKHVTDMGKPFAFGYDDEYFKVITEEEFKTNIKKDRKSVV